MKIEPTILQDIYDLFNDTINQNAHKALRRILTDKQDNITAIRDRQQVIKCFIDNYGLFSDYHYPVLQYREVFLMIEPDNLMKIELTILQDIYDLFNDTINQNAHNALRRILTDKQDNITAIRNRQQVIKCFIDNYGLFSDYHYPVLHYREVFLMIETDNFIQ